MKFKFRADLAKKPRQAAKRKRIIEVELDRARGQRQSRSAARQPATDRQRSQRSATSNRARRSRQPLKHVRQRDNCKQTDRDPLTQLEGPITHHWSRSRSSRLAFARNLSGVFRHSRQEQMYPARRASAFGHESSSSMRLISALQVPSGTRRAGAD